MKKAEWETNAAPSQEIKGKYPKQEAPWIQMKQKYYWDARQGRLMDSTQIDTLKERSCWPTAD